MEEVKRVMAANQYSKDTVIQMMLDYKNLFPKASKQSSIGWLLGYVKLTRNDELRTYQISSSNQYTLVSIFIFFMSFLAHFEQILTDNNRSL